ncbi:MAG TPA: DUF1214 domain-containing protein [Rhodoblastus sp.]|nr:DUF1214 domain-containing protein [Rhodoblastus sp.]
MSVAQLQTIEETRSRLGAYAKSAIAGLVGVGLGLAATYVATLGAFPFGAARSGPWTSWPKAGAVDADPYARAIIARQAAAPLGNGEGVAFLATTDDAGRPLDGACDYRLAGSPPVARLWTINLFTPEGALLAPGPGRRSISSDQVLRASNGGFEIVIAPAARAGNWLSTPKGAPFAISLNLYDTNVSPTQTSLEGLALLSITRGNCP